MSPDAFRDNREYWNGPDGSAKRKLPGSVEEKAGRDEKEELIRQRQHFMQYANPNGYPMGSDRRGEFLARTSSPSRRDLVDEMRATKYMRIGGGHDSGGTGLKHLEVDQIKLKKACFHFVKVVYENPSLRKNYLEDGKQGRLQCLVCGRFDEFGMDLTPWFYLFALFSVELVIGLLFLLDLLLYFSKI